VVLSSCRMEGTEHQKIELARTWIGEAQALLVCAGAGMGVDSGLPDFRGNEGFWKAYPPIRDRGIPFHQMANPGWFEKDPRLAWGFYGHRLNLYRRTEPHEGFQRLLAFGQGLPGEYFAFTSNVDGHFQKAGFESRRVLECHGSINRMQCSKSCGQELWSAGDLRISVDEENFMADEPLPRCPACGAVARPNILMFGDWLWDERASGAQRREYEIWLKAIGQADLRLLVIEIGAGTAIPSVRAQSEHQASPERARLIRINPREAQVPSYLGERALGIEMGGVEALGHLFP
jgi:NAD-dependent SIR2 family protein deacetylase